MLSRVLILSALVLLSLCSVVRSTCYFEEFGGSFTSPNGQIFLPQTYSFENNTSPLNEYFADTCTSTCSTTVTLAVAIGPQDSLQVTINNLYLNSQGNYVQSPNTYAHLNISQNTLNPLNGAKFYTGQNLSFPGQTVTFPIYHINYTSWICPTASEKVTNEVQFTTFLLGTCSISENFWINRQCASAVKGDPVFNGFYGQEYEVHGVAGNIFNLISSQSAQVNSRFIFLDEGEALNAGQQLQIYTDSVLAEEAASTSSNKLLRVIRQSIAPRVLPLTTAWSHPGTYLGEIGVMVRSGVDTHSLHVVAGRYQEGFESLTLDGKIVPQPTGNNFQILTTPNVTITVVSPSAIRVSTEEVAFLVVNSDGFLNVDEARLTPLTIAQPSLLEGLIGQSADQTRYFPHFKLTEGASSEEKGDWQSHQQLDYVIHGDDIFSTDCPLNKF